MVYDPSFIKLQPTGVYNYILHGIKGGGGEKNN